MSPPGITAVKFQGVDCLKVELAKAFPSKATKDQFRTDDVNFSSHGLRNIQFHAFYDYDRDFKCVSIWALAKLVHLTPIEVLASILWIRPANDLAIRGLKREEHQIPFDLLAAQTDSDRDQLKQLRSIGAYNAGNYGDPGDDAAEITWTARLLFEQAFDFKGDEKKYKTVPLYPDWRLPYQVKGKNVVVLLPKSPAYTSLFSSSGSAGTTVTVKSKAPDFSPLTKALDDIDGVALSLGGALSGVRDMVERNITGYTALESADALLRAMKNWPRGSPSDGDKNSCAEIAKHLTALKREAQKDLLDAPTMASSDVQSRDKLSVQLRAKLNSTADDGLKALLRTLVAPDPSLVPVELWTRVIDVTRNAYALLADTREAQDISDKEIQGLIDSLAAGPVGLPQPADDFLKTLFLSTVSVAASLHGNTAGPSVLFVSVFRVYFRHFITSVIKASDGDRQARIDKLVKVLGSKIAAFSDAEQTELLDKVHAHTKAVKAVANPEAPTAAEEAAIKDARDALKKFDGSAHMMNAPGWGGFVAILNAVLLVDAVNSADSVPDVLTRWGNIAGAGASLALDLGLLFQNTSKQMAAFASGSWEAGAAMDLKVAGSFGRLLGVVGSAVAFYNGVSTVVDGMNNRDTAEEVIGYATAGSGLLAAAGYLMTIGAGTAGLGVGDVLMIAGAVLGLAATVMSWYEAHVTAKSETAFDELITTFANDKWIGYALDKNSTMKDELDKVRAGQKAGGWFSHFWWDMAASHDSYYFLRQNHFGWETTRNLLGGMDAVKVPEDQYHKEEANAEIQAYKKGQKKIQDDAAARAKKLADMKTHEDAQHDRLFTQHPAKFTIPFRDDDDSWKTKPT